MVESSKELAQESSSANNYNNNSEELYNKPADSIIITTETNPKPPYEIHKVCLPPHTTTRRKLKHRLFEIFFSDDPLSIFRNHSFCRKVDLGIRYVFPIFQWLPTYNFKLFGSDLISGITIASLAIPQVRYLTHISFLLLFVLLCSLLIFLLFS